MAEKTTWVDCWVPMLVDELLKHNNVQAMQNANPSDFEKVRRGLLEDLAKLDLDEADILNFQVKLPEQTYAVYQAPDVCHTLTPRRILLTDKAQGYQFGKLRTTLAKVVDTIGSFSSDAWVRRIRENPQLARELVHSKSPFALLSKYEIVDSSVQGREEFATYPILTVPGLSDSQTLKAWETSCRPKPRTEKIYSLAL